MKGAGEGGGEQGNRGKEKGVKKMGGRRGRLCREERGKREDAKGEVRKKGGRERMGNGWSGDGGGEGVNEGKGRMERI